MKKKAADTLPKNRRGQVHFGRLRWHHPGATQRVGIGFLYFRKIPLRVPSRLGEYYAGLMAQETGCGPLKITARVTGSAAEPSVSIPFQCGE